MKINYQYTFSTNPIIELEQNLHNLWHTIIVSASVTPVDDAGQDRLAVEILLAREMGLLSRTTTGNFEKSVTSEGDRIWTDLPHLVDDFRGYWYKHHLGMDPARRSNLIAFMARLTALGVCDGALSSTAIQMFKVAFEPKRPPLDEDATSNLEPLALLVPECLLWIRFCGYKLLALATQNHSFW
jgi:hypothetical protein